MSSSSEHHLPELQKIHQILEAFYDPESENPSFEFDPYTFFEEIVVKESCRTQDHSVSSNQPDSCPIISYYTKINEFQRNHVEDLCASSFNLENEDLLIFFVRRWHIYEAASIKLDLTCKPFYDHFTKHHVDLLPMAFTVYTVALILLKMNSYNFVERVIETAITILNRERRREICRTVLAHETMRIVVHIATTIAGSTYSEKTQNGQIEVLPSNVLQIESIYDDNTRSFYMNASVQMLLQNNAADYLRKVKLILIEEYRKCRYLYRMPRKMAEKIKLSLSKVLIDDHKSVLVPYFYEVMAANEVTLLREFYYILKIAANPDLFESFSNCFHDSVVFDGNFSIENGSHEFPSHYIVVVLQMMRKYNILVQTVFRDNEYFSKATKGAVSLLLNYSSPTGNKSTVESAKLFASYCHYVLGELNPNRRFPVRETNYLLACLDDKYIFKETFYELLVKSLVCMTSINEQYEREILSFVKSWRSPDDFTYESRIKDMIKDARTSHVLNGIFSSNASNFIEGYNNELTIIVLKEEHWPFAKQNFGGTLPQRFLIEFEVFSDLYNTVFPQRKLTLLHQMSRADVSSHCFRKNYTFHLNLNQLIILLQFNKAESYSIARLLEDTEIDEEYFNQGIQKFIEAGILKYETDNENPQNRTHVMLNMDYENEKGCVKLVELEFREASERNDYIISEENKCFAIQAAIVRIMKKKLFLNHDELVADTFEDMKTKFYFTSDMIDKSIDKLIRSGFIKRSQESEGHYIYIP